ncbi:MAG: PIN domain-containing protein [Candidatus Lokiarchaeota archaeon]|nr:PIN domain-containing protein [Candidatus Lokiarchaeota archaeon]MBD3201714.1 PIN domain-containing protein [Candidatus Lokiarchaeota archaeon]
MLNAVDNNEHEAIVSIISIAELYVGFYKANESRERNIFINGLYSNQQYKILNIDLYIADKSAEIKNETHLRLPDALITASFVMEKCDCLITNDPHFTKANIYIPVYSVKAFCENFL